jgi:serine/threonine protein kinase
MRSDSGRWVEVSPSEFPHERAGLAMVRDLLPDRPPYRAWSNFEFRDTSGKWHEIDLLVLGESRLHLVELKSWAGRIEGDAYRWRIRGRTSESPLLLTRRKAQRLAGVLAAELRKLDATVSPRVIPYVQESVFLHHVDSVCALPPADRTDLFGIEGQERRSGLPSIRARLMEPATTAHAPRLLHDDAQLLVALFNRIGFAQRREQEVGSWRLAGPAEAEGEGWQDWPAEQRIARTPARIRFTVSRPGTPREEAERDRRLVEREYDLTSRLSHDGLLRPVDLVEHELGVGLVYLRDADSRRLDLWLSDRDEDLTLPARLQLVRRLAEALGYAHANHVVHRGLSPAAVQVRDREGSAQVLLGDWRLVGGDVPGARSTGGATRLFAALEGPQRPDPEARRAEVYRAPEERWDPAADRVRLDVFSLGALAYLIVTGRPPATDQSDLRERVRREDGLDVAADRPEVPYAVRRLVRDATRGVVSRRLPDVTAFLRLLDDAERAAADPDADDEQDPLEAVAKATLAGRFELVHRLGSGSTAAGLLVADGRADGEHRVLKVALDDAAARRLADEAEVLAPLRHPRLVRLVEGPLRIGPRTALLLEHAGEQTLADVLRERPRLSLDLLERYGSDLLEAVVELDRAGVDHRDIKPANLGVREQRGDRTKHLVLFDFSLARAGAAALDAGTPPYLDPFLGTDSRTRWDSAAERYAAAVTLYEMATGQAPVFGDGRTPPDVARVEASVEPGAFDPSAAGALTAFFRRALRQEATQRHGSAADMLADWRAVFRTPAATVPDDVASRAAAAQPDTPLAESGLSARALSALEPLAVATVGDLARLDAGRLSRLAGTAEPTRREIRTRAKQWRERFGGNRPGPGSEQPEAAGTAAVDLDGAVTVLLDAVGGKRATQRRRMVQLVLGLDGALDADAPPVEIAGVLGVSRARVSAALAECHDAWAAAAAARDVLDGILHRAHAAVLSLGGLALTGEVADDLAPDGADDGVRRRLLGLFRLAADRAEQVERGGGDPAPVLRRRRDARAGARMLFATEPSLLDAAGPLGRAADELVVAASAADARIVPAAQVAGVLRGLWPADAGLVDDLRLARLASRLSQRAAASRRGELHDRALPLTDALVVALGAVSASQVLTPDGLAASVRARFPELPVLPGRPRLDQLVTAAGLDVRWDGEKKGYVTSSRGAPTTGLATRLTVSPAQLADLRLRSTVDARLAESVATRSFLALGVLPGLLDETARALTGRHPAVPVDVTAVLLDAVRALAAQRSVPWSEVSAADAAEPGSRPAQGLAALVRAALPVVRSAVDAACDAAPEGTVAVLLTEAAPLARYGHVELLAAYADLTARRRQAVWLLLPLGSEGTPTLDRTPVPLAHGGQFLPLPTDWIREPALEGEPA